MPKISPSQRDSGWCANKMSKIYLLRGRDFPQEVSVEMGLGSLTKDNTQ